MNRRRRIINPDSLYLIAGIYKTRSWSVAAFENVTEDAHHTAHFKQIEGSSTGPPYSWETTTCALDWRVGPDIDFGVPNQAVFIRGFKIAIRSGLLGTRWVSVKADAPSPRLYPMKGTNVAASNSTLLNSLAGFVGRMKSNVFQSTRHNEGTTNPREEPPENNNLDHGGHDGMRVEFRGYQIYLPCVLDFCIRRLAFRRP